MKNRVLSILLTLTMLLGMVPAMGTTAWALPEYVCQIGEAEYSSIAAALAAAHTDESTENPTVITLIGDVSENVIISGDNPDTEEVDETRYITLDLNGFVLKAKTVDSVITNSGVLTIKDSDSTKEHKYVVGSNGLWTWNDNAEGSAKAYESLTARPEEGDVITVKGGAITGGKGKNKGGIPCGGGVYNTGSLTVTVVNFVGNSASCGGGIYNEDDGSLSVSGGSITGNYASNSGGGIYNDGTFFATDCDISHNTTVTGGGIYNSSSGTLTVTGGSITDNTATENGGGIYIYASYCFTEGTKITMADGNTKNIEDISVGDYVKSFNHETGAYESNRVILAYEGERAEKYFTLHFSDGTDLSICGGHDLFEQSVNHYVTVSESNAGGFIGKQFYNADTDTWETLLSVTYSNNAKKYYSIYVARTFNCLANGMLSVPDDDLHLDMYTFNADLTANQEVLQADIAEYGLFLFEQCKLVDTFEEYEAFGLKYYNIMLGKGIATEEEVEATYYEWYADTEEQSAVLTAKSVQNDAPYTLTASLVQYEGEETAPLTVGGTAKITGNTAGGKVNNVYLCDGKTIKIGTFENGASVGVTLNTGTGKFTTNYVNDAENYFFSDEPVYTVKYDTDHLELVGKVEATTGTTTIHYTSIENALKHGGDNTSDIPFGEDTTSPTLIKLLGDCTENVTIPENRNITLNLNGFVLSGTGSGSVITNSGTLYITDSDTTAQTHYFKVNSNGLWELDNTLTTADYTFDAVNGLKKSGTTTTDIPATGNVIKVTGGCITGGIGAGAGDGGGVTNNGIFTLESGNIIGNSPADSIACHGGGVSNSGTFVMNGGCIIGNHSYHGGAGVFNYGSGTFTLNNGSISRNSADECGGGIGNDGTIIITGGSISKNAAKNNGGGIYTSSATSADIKNCKLLGNAALTEGGAVFIQYRASIENCEISSNTASKGGGISLQSGGKVALRNTAITNNTATNCGGGIYSGDNGCFTAGTKITMADGSLKNIEDIRDGDIIRTFDHETGMLSSEAVRYVYHEEGLFGTFTLHFTNSIDVNVISGHDFLEQSTRKYVVITESNVTEYIGKYFYNADEARWEQLLGITYGEEQTDCYGIYSARHINCVAEGMLNVCYDSAWLVNLFEKDENLRFDQADKQADIEQYGLLAYEDTQYATPETYEYWNNKYANIALGKGLVTYESMMFSRISAYYYFLETQGIHVLTGSMVQQSGTENTLGTWISWSNETEPTVAILISSAVTIQNNHSGDTQKDDNVYLVSSQYLKKLDNLAGTKIGITISTGRGQITTNGLAGDTQYFTSDNNAYYVKYDTANSYLVLDDVSNRPASPDGDSTSTVTVPVSGDKDTVKVQATVSGSNATIKNVTSEEITQVGTGDNVTVDLSALSKSVTGVTIPKTTFENVAASDAAGLEVKLPNGTIAVFDKTTLKAVASQAKGVNIQLVVDRDSKAEQSMTKAQKEVVSEMNKPVVLDAYFVSNGVRISDFKGGEADIIATYETVNPVRVWYVTDDGTKELVPSTFDGKEASFTVKHFSHYVIEMLDGSSYNTCPQDSTCVYAKFSDANPKEWYHSGVHFCVEYGYMNGVDNGLFAPNGTLSRAMIVTMLWRMEGSPVVNYAMSFKDVADSQWYTEAIRWAQSTGVVLGYDETSFGPNDNVTREQLAAILWRYAKLKGYDVSVGEDTNILSYDDAIGGISEYAIPAMQWACGAGIINGIGNKLEARGFATRAQAACMIQRFCVNVK